MTTAHALPAAPDDFAVALTDAATPAAYLDAAHRAVVHAATLAPSVHNSQPWTFTADDGGLDLHADAARRLPVLDPEGRLVHLSCGAALLHAQVAARALGFCVDPLLMPDPSDPGHLARLGLTAGPPASVRDHALANAIALRHTHRDAFDQRPVPPALLAELRRAAEAHGASLAVVTGDDLIELEVLLAWADQVEEADPAYLAETAASVRTGPSPDGIPAAALADDPERGSSLRLRDFAQTGPRPTGGEPPLAEKPAVVLIVSDDDHPLSWLCAGQALGAVLLRAAQDGVMGQPLAQATDFPAARVRLRKALGLVGVPQMALRLGYAPAVAPTPRRHVDDVLSRLPRPSTADARTATGALAVWESEGGHLRPSPGWTPAVALADLPDGTALGVSLSGRPVCLVRTGGRVHALLDECSHGKVRLSEGDVDGSFLECWLHGSRFDLCTGRPAGPPATAPVPVYPVRVVDGMVEVALPARAGDGDAR